MRVVDGNQVPPSKLVQSLNQGTICWAEQKTRLDLPSPEQLYPPPVSAFLYPRIRDFVLLGDNQTAACIWGISHQ